MGLFGNNEKIKELDVQVYHLRKDLENMYAKFSKLENALAARFTREKRDKELSKPESEIKLTFNCFNEGDKIFLNIDNVISIFNNDMRCFTIGPNTYIFPITIGKQFLSNGQLLQITNIKKQTIDNGVILNCKLVKK